MRLIAPMLFLASLSFIQTASAQQPAVLHTTLSIVSADHGIGTEIDRLKRSGSLLWAGYQIPVGPDFHIGGNDNSTEYLEAGHTYEGQGSYKHNTVDHVVILLRISGGVVEKLRLTAPDRQLDAGGLPFVWINGVNSADSIQLLKALATERSPKVKDEAVFFISVHQSAEATPALVQLTRPANDLELREKAAFWLANQRGRDGFLAIQRMAHEDADAAFREKLTFDLTLCHEPAAVDELIRMAKEDSSPKVRQQAQFWMAQKGGEKVVARLHEITSNDPDEEVRQSAVFAVSRLPGSEAATQLIQLATTSPRAEVRKQAVFWLGQSKDPRAFDYLAQLVKQ